MNEWRKKIVEVVMLFTHAVEFIFQLMEAITNKYEFSTLFFTVHNSSSPF